MFGVGEAGDVFAVGDGGGVAATDDLGAEREMDFVNEVGAEECAVQFATAFAEQSFDFPLLTQPLKSRAKINFTSTADFYGVRDSAQPS